MPASTRFSYIQYDRHATEQQAQLKAKFEELEVLCNALEDGRPKSLVMTKLEEAYMWTGKAIRDAQIKKGAPVEEQPHRKNG
jgi:hypothetical protein